MGFMISDGILRISNICISIMTRHLSSVLACDYNLHSLAFTFYCRTSLEVIFLWFLNSIWLYLYSIYVCTNLIFHNYNLKSFSFIVHLKKIHLNHQNNTRNYTNHIFYLRKKHLLKFTYYLYCRFTKENIFKSLKNHRNHLFELKRSGHLQ